MRGVNLLSTTLGLKGILLIIEKRKVKNKGFTQLGTGIA
jgi:hypothetical protein